MSNFVANDPVESTPMNNRAGIRFFDWSDIVVRVPPNPVERLRESSERAQRNLGKGLELANGFGDPGF